ncbi:MAG: exodeoxyribonuclease VII large subunit [Phycisphaerae bacterium]|nr:exodeoxyribonuclease VII large subunit [Phycisphaerae bacterium]
MARLPFDPKKMEQARGPKGPDAPLTVSQLALRIDGALKAGMPGSVRVVGEVFGLRERTHWYFSLKDESAVVECVMFAGAARVLGFTPRDGTQVVVTGRIDFYAKGGRVSLIAEKIEPVGAGALELRLRRLIEEIRALGWLDPARKRKPPTFPRRVAVITSRTGAALQDVLATMKKRCPAVGVLVVDVRVQGVGAADEIAEAIRRVGRRHDRLGVDAILVTRGGGSMEDLWAFNERAVAEAIVTCPIPVVAAIGHETDTTVAELVADERGATPTQAAMRLTPDTAALLQQLDALGRRVAGQVRRHLSADRRRLESLAGRPVLADPRELVERGAEDLRNAATGLRAGLRECVARQRRRVDQLALRLERQRPAAVHARLGERVRAAGERLRRAGRVLVRERGQRLGALERHLRGVGPIAVLERGFSVTLGADGKALRSVAGVVPGDVLQTRLADGSLKSIVRGDPVRRDRPRGRSQTEPPSLFEPR